VKPFLTDKAEPIEGRSSARMCENRTRPRIREVCIHGGGPDALVVVLRRIDVLPESLVAFRRASRFMAGMIFVVPSTLSPDESPQRRPSFFIRSYSRVPGGLAAGRPWRCNAAL